MRQLVSTEWLEKNIDNVKILDASWHLPNSNRKAKDEYKLNHIENSIFLISINILIIKLHCHICCPIKMIGTQLYQALELKTLIILLFMIIQMYLAHVEYGTRLFILDTIQA